MEGLSLVLCVVRGQSEEPGRGGRYETNVRQRSNNDPIHMFSLSRAPQQSPRISQVTLSLLTSLPVVPHENGAMSHPEEESTIVTAGGNHPPPCSTIMEDSQSDIIRESKSHVVPIQLDRESTPHTPHTPPLHHPPAAMTVTLSHRSTLKIPPTAPTTIVQSLQPDTSTCWRGART